MKVSSLFKMIAMVGSIFYFMGVDAKRTKGNGHRTRQPLGETNAGNVVQTFQDVSELVTVDMALLNPVYHNLFRESDNFPASNLISMVSVVGMIVLTIAMLRARRLNITEDALGIATNGGIVAESVLRRIRPGILSIAQSYTLLSDQIFVFFGDDVPWETIRTGLCNSNEYAITDAEIDAIFAYIRDYVTYGLGSTVAFPTFAYIYNVWQNKDDETDDESDLSDDDENSNPVVGSHAHID